VQDILADQNTAVGIQVTGQGALVRRNQIMDTGGSTYAPNLVTYGIYVQGAGSLIESNLVSGLNATGNGNEYAIGLVSTAAQSTVRGNVVTDNAHPTGGGYSFGINISNTPSVGIRGNEVIHFDYGIRYTGSATGIYSRNVVIDSYEAYLGGTAGTGND